MVGFFSTKIFSFTLWSLTFFMFCSSSFAGTVGLVSKSITGTPANDRSLMVAEYREVSADGRFVVYHSLANDVVTGDTNGTWDVFVYDREFDASEIVSVSSDEVQANSASFVTGVSADGRYVVFYSLADNLVINDTNGAYDVFIRDREAGVTELVSVSSEEVQGDFESRVASISDDGRYVAFQTKATNFDIRDINGKEDIYLRDRMSGTTTMVSIPASGQQEYYSRSTSPKISGDGRIISFVSGATNLIASDTNSKNDIFVYERETGEISRANVASDGTEANDHEQGHSLSHSGRFVAFASKATNLVGDDYNGGNESVFVHDRETGETELVSKATDGSQSFLGAYRPTISANGRFIAFDTNGSLASNDNNLLFDVYVHDRSTGSTDVVSVDSFGMAQGGQSGIVSAYGKFVAFWGDLDTNGILDVYLYTDYSCP